MIPIIGLSLFFLILAERITPEAVIIGVLISYAVLRLQKKEASDVQSDKPLYVPRFWVLWLKLITVLIREIILANFQVAGIVLSPRMRIAPEVHPYVTKLKDERLIVVLSNAITLTPGTMTVDVKGSHLDVHALNDAYFESLSGNPVEKILLEMEAKLLE